MMLSTVYRIQQMSGIGFGAGHVMDVLRGKRSEKVGQFGHAALSTFGIGAAIAEAQWRAVARQLIAMGALTVDAEHYNTLALTEASRAVLRGEVPVRLRESVAEAPAGARAGRSGARADARPKRAPVAVAALPESARARFDALKAWRAEVAREHGLPAYVIFHDATLAAIAEREPRSLADLQGISGIGAAKLERYGEEVLRVCMSGEVG
jgi:ATP-dependent DNA helicase RecQ